MGWTENFCGWTEIFFGWAENDRVREVGWRINGTAVFARGKVGYLSDLSFRPCPAALQIAEIVSALR